ncbi:hypothetical protein HanPSC8_Chr16g0745931 [Helianthus annuus]|nr:hypothetical protein HanPSC8_Chr16g0745931 [Helianthus annuus]
MTRLGGHQHAIEQKHHLSQSLAEQSSPLVSCVLPPRLSLHHI